MNKKRMNKTGKVVSDKNDKTIVVLVERKVKHPLLGVYHTKSKKFHVHDPLNQYKVGDIVNFVQSRPLSKLKRWTVEVKK